MKPSTHGDERDNRSPSRICSSMSSLAILRRLAGVSIHRLEPPAGGLRGGPWGCWRGSAETSRLFGRATKIPLIGKPFPQLVTLAWRGREISSSSVKIGIEFALSRTPQHAHLLASSLPLTARWLHDGSRARPLRFTLDPRGVYVEGLLYVAPPSVWRLGHAAVNDASRR
jgi:hypothetical protein